MVRNGWVLRRRGAGSGFAVRLDWCTPRNGEITHDFTQFTPSLRRAVRRAARTQRFWAAGPLRPLAVTVVPIEHAAYRAHHRECTGVGCPTTAALLGMRAPALDPVS